jgi:hypothetical protein
VPGRIPQRALPVVTFAGGLLLGVLVVNGTGGGPGPAGASGDARPGPGPAGVSPSPPRSAGSGVGGRRAGSAAGMP